MKTFIHRIISFIRFSISSLVCAGTDLAVFTVLTDWLFDQSASGILAATVVARCLSGALNFTLNKKWCFASHGHAFRQMTRYGALFVSQMLLSWLIVTLLSGLPANLTLIKMITDGGLFVLSYLIQRKLIFPEQLAAGR